MNKILEVKGITKSFHLSKKQQKISKTSKKVIVAVNDVSFEIYEGEIFGLLGPNGAGKTTALRMIATLIKQETGTIIVDGIDNSNGVETRKKLAFLTNELKLDEQFTPNYIFDYYALFYGLSKEETSRRKLDIFKQFGIDEFAEVKIGDLSTGMKQKVCIAVSLVNDPKIIIFDEPTNGLDVITARVVIDFLKNQRDLGKTIIISTHIMDLANKICDRVGMIINGSLVECEALDKIYEKYGDTDLENIFFNIYDKVNEVNKYE